MAASLNLQAIPISDEGQFSELLDRCFSVPEGHHYLDDFPVWRDQTSGIFKLGAYDGEQLVGIAAARVAEVSGRHAAYTLGLIGAVATDEKYRRRGIAGKLVSLADEWARNRGAILSALWGSEHTLYGHLGFFPCGKQVRVPLSAILESQSPVRLNEGWNAAIFQQLQARRSGIRFSEVDRLWFSKHSNVRWFWTGPSERPSAFAALGRGIDLSHIVHEWGGEPQDLLPLLHAISKIDSHSDILGSPETFSRVGIQYDPSRIEYLCLAHLIDPVKLFRAFVSQEQAPFFAAKLRGGDWHLEMEDHLGKSSKLNIPQSDLGRVFFGPKTASEKELKAPWASIFPLPLWFWGLDAV